MFGGSFFFLQNVKRDRPVSARPRGCKRRNPNELHRGEHLICFVTPQFVPLHRLFTASSPPVQLPHRCNKYLCLFTPPFCSNPPPPVTHQMGLDLMRRLEIEPSNLNSLKLNLLCSMLSGIITSPLEVVRIRCSLFLCPWRGVHSGDSFMQTGQFASLVLLHTDGMLTHLCD